MIKDTLNVCPFIAFMSILSWYTNEGNTDEDNQLITANCTNWIFFSVLIYSFQCYWYASIHRFIFLMSNWYWISNICIFCIKLPLRDQLFPNIFYNYNNCCFNEIRKLCCMPVLHLICVIFCCSSVLMTEIFFRIENWTRCRCNEVWETVGEACTI